MAWISDEEIADRLRKEAERDASRLGHTLAGWLLDRKTFRTHCVRCRAECAITPRTLGMMRIRGEATQFRCKV